MNYLTRKSIFALLLFVLPTFALAAEQHKTITFDQQATVAGQELKPGDYTFRWDDSKDTTNVEIQRNGKTVATAPARVIHASNPFNATYEINTANGQKHLARVYFSKEQLTFADSTESGANSVQGSTPAAQ